MDMHSSTQPAQTACMEPRLSQLIWIKVCLLLRKRHSRSCQCACIGDIEILDTLALATPCMSLSILEVTAERDLLAPTMQSSSCLGMRESNALKQYRSAQRIQLRLSLVESGGGNMIGHKQYRGHHMMQPIPGIFSYAWWNVMPEGSIWLSTDAITSRDWDVGRKIGEAGAKWMGLEPALNQTSKRQCN
jgi:hypothetical protein